MKKRVFSFLLALMLLLSYAVVPAMAAEDGVTIKLHYHRPDGVYDDWGVWFWDFGKEGADYPFVEENGEMVATYVADHETTKVGFIVKLPNWAQKDVNEDQFIELGGVISGTIHIYVESGVKGYETVYGDDVVKAIKIKEAEYDGDLTVHVTTTDPLPGDPNEAFTLTENGEAVSISGIRVSEKEADEYTIQLNGKLNHKNVYKIIYDNKEYDIVIPDQFSTDAFEAEYTYTGNDLGATWTSEKTTFRVWAPTANDVKVNLYTSGTEGTKDLIEQIPMTADVNGTWVAEKEGDLNGTYYTYLVDVQGKTNEACDPYARATGVNGKRAMVIDLDSTDPEGWDKDTDPNAGINFTDAVIYELHVRDLSIDESSGITNKGKYLGLIETGTKTASGIPTGLDHMKDLGITHLHILPMYDYGSVDESKLDKAQFNWGYDPVNYNVPEGSYSSDPYNGAVRISEVKQMVKGLHDNGISVVMDVVYNHVYDAGAFCFNKIVPNYFSRTTKSGTFSNGSGCGNDTASERSMVKKYIVDSVVYWADEYHIDGFRFDLVGLIDTITINEVIEEVHKTHPNVVFYGEGWTMTTLTTKKDYLMTTQANSAETPEFAFFSDTIRDLLKGSVFDTGKTGYVSGASVGKSQLEKCFTGTPAWTKNPTQCVNYVSCHDNNTLIDRITLSTPDATREERVKMNNLAAAFCLTSQGTPFFQAGEEMLRSKPLPNGGFDHNSYTSSDEINSIKWDNLNEAEYMTTYNYYKGLIAFRKAHPALRLTSGEEAKANITLVEHDNKQLVAFQINGGINGETAESLFVIFNASAEAVDVTLPEGKWTVYVSGDKAGTEVLGAAEGTVSVEGISAMVLAKDGATEKSIIPAIIAGAAALGAAVAGAAILLKKKGKK